MIKVKYRIYYVVYLSVCVTAMLISDGKFCLEKPPSLYHISSLIQIYHDSTFLPFRKIFNNPCSCQGFSKITSDFQKSLIFNIHANIYTIHGPSPK